MLLRSISIMAFAATGCQERPQAPTAQVIELHEGGRVTARITPGSPCRAMIGATELQVSGRPLLAQSGTTRWTGEDSDNGTVLRMDGAQIARIMPADVMPNALDLFDPQGIALFRARAHGETATISNAGGVPIRRATKLASAIQVEPTAAPAATVTVTGTTDLLLAAVLTATEATPEVRALAACHRLLPPARAL